MVIFSDGWETGQTWLVLWSGTVNRVTTDPFEGSYCLKLEKHFTGDGGGAYHDNLFGDVDELTIDVAMKYVPDVGNTGAGAQVYIYNPQHTRLFAIIGININGECTVSGGDGGTILYAGSVNTWYHFRLLIKWSTKKFDCWLYDKDGGLLGSVTNKTSLENLVVVVIAHMLFYLPSNEKGTAYYDGVVTQQTIPTSISYTEYLTLSDQQVLPEDVGGCWIQGFWVRKVRARLDKTLADDHNIPKAVLGVCRDILKERVF